MAGRLGGHLDDAPVRSQLPSREQLHQGLSEVLVVDSVDEPVQAAVEVPQRHAEAE